MYKISLVFWRMGELGILLLIFSDGALTLEKRYFFYLLTFEKNMSLHSGFFGPQSIHTMSSKGCQGQLVIGHGKRTVGLKWIKKD